MAPRVSAGAATQRSCPGCGLTLPVSDATAYEGFYNASPECWSVFAEVLGREYGNPVLHGSVHSLTVDAYAVQHAGGEHPDESVGLHLAGLFLVLERGVRPRSVPLLQGRLAELVRRWPAFPLPEPKPDPLRVFDVAVCGPSEAYMRTVREWAADVWATWSEHHARIAHLVARHVPLPVQFPDDSAPSARFAALPD